MPRSTTTTTRVLAESKPAPKAPKVTASAPVPTKAPKAVAKVTGLEGQIDARLPGLVNKTGPYADVLLTWRTAIIASGIKQVEPVKMVDTLIHLLCMGNYIPLGRMAEITGKRALTVPKPPTAPKVAPKAAAKPAPKAAAPKPATPRMVEKRTLPTSAPVTPATPAADVDAAVAEAAQ